MTIPPDTLAIEVARYISKIVAILFWIACAILGAWGGNLYFQGSDVPQVGFIFGGFLGLLVGSLVALPVWVAFEMIDLLIAIELNTRIAANRLENK